MTSTKQRLLLLMAGFFFNTMISAQGYQAVNGSPYAGGVGVYNNPAASVQSAYKWDLTLFSTQFKVSSNSPYVKNFTLKNQDSAYLTYRQGFNSVFLHSNLDLNLLNFSYKIDNNKAFNFGLRARTYNHIKTMPANFVDSVVSVNGFMIANANTPFLDGFVTHSGWLEADLNYSQVLFENSTSRLSGGATLQIMKGMSGAYLKINKLSFLESKNATDTSFYISGGGGSYAYSDSYDGYAGQTTINDFLKSAVTRLGLSLGVEYLTYKNDYGNNNINYDWKIGVSLMDLGSNSFKPSAFSGQFSNPLSTVTDRNLYDKLFNVTGTKQLKDSLKTIFQDTVAINGNFIISNPTRLIVNVDKNLGNNFFVNGELSMNFFSTSSYTHLRTRELNLLTITPRWETIGWGAYMPIQYNTQGQLWVGAAVKMGPLLMGLHSFGIFKKDPTINGGFYMLLSFHPFNKRKVLSKMDCPE